MNNKLEKSIERSACVVTVFLLIKYVNRKVSDTKKEAEHYIL